MERPFRGILKFLFLLSRNPDYVALDDAQQHLDRFIGELYNRGRLHSSLSYVPPAEFTARYHSAQRGLAWRSSDSGAFQYRLDGGRG